jgi:hypothetical protein
MAYARSNAGDDQFMDMLADAGQRGQVFLKNGRLCFAAPAAKVNQLSAKRKRAGEPPSELDIMCGYDDEDDFLGDQVGMQARHTPLQCNSGIKPAADQAARCASEGTLRRQTLQLNIFWERRKDVVMCTAADSPHCFRGNMRLFVTRITKGCGT